MQEELGRLESAYEAAQLSKLHQGSFELIGLNHFYTLQGLKVDLHFTAPPKSSIIIQAENGGHFVSTRLPYVEIIANDQGLASAQWVTYGDAVSECFLSAQCSLSKEELKPSVTVVQLQLEPPFALPVSSVKAANKIAPIISQ